MNYKIRKLNERFAIIETQTKLIVQFFSQHKEAQRLASKLNQGAAFDGWSPTFITTRERI